MKFPKAFNKEGVRVVIETPYKSRNKYKYDEETGMFKLHKILPSGLEFPCDMGFIPHTKGEDGDPLDALVFGAGSAFPGCLIECRLIGVIKAIQIEKNGEEFRNDRFIMVPLIMRESDDIKSVNEINKNKMDAIIKFFQNYNEQEERKFKLLEIGSSRTAESIIKKHKV